MAKLCSEYIELLSSSAPSSEKFWALDERLRHDKRSAGVWVRMSRSEMPFIILRLLDEGTITMDDLAEFSDEMKAFVEFHRKNHSAMMKYLSDDDQCIPDELKMESQHDFQ